MRLSEKDRDALKQTCVEYFNTDEIYLFGSGADDDASGGDIDLYIVPPAGETPEVLFNKKVRFLSSAKQRIGDQKIDVVLACDSDRLIEREAREKGIRL